MCATTSCPVSPEACCFGDGTCTEVAPAECALAGGASRGAGTRCATTSCPVGQEACCFGDGTCADTDPASCGGAGGKAEGPGTLCATSSCPVFPEACCFGDGTCTEVAPAECALAGGDPQGAGSDCAASNCPSRPVPGAVPNGAAARPGAPLRVRKAPAPPDLRLDWSASCSPDAVDYTIYEGRIGAWYSHDEILCGTPGGARTAVLTPGAGGRYYLVVPVTASDEGSYGVDSTGAERQRGGLTCLPTRILGCP